MLPGGLIDTKVFSNLQLAVVEALVEISSWPDRESSSPALQLLSTIRQREFCIAFLVSKNILGSSGILCKVMQKTSINLLEAVNIAQYIIKELKLLWQNAKHEFHQLYTSAQETAQAQQFRLEMPRLTARMTSSTILLLQQMKTIFEQQFLYHFSIVSFLLLSLRCTAHKAIIGGFQCL